VGGGEKSERIPSHSNSKQESDALLAATQMLSQKNISREKLSWVKSSLDPYSQKKTKGFERLTICKA